MKKLSVFLCSLVLVFGVVVTANAALWDRGGGLIYDDVLDITWLQDMNAGTWANVVAWADGLEYYDSVRDVTWRDWRLPKTLPVNGTTYDTNQTYNGSTDQGYNISAPGSVYPGSTASEMAYMYYVNLGNLGQYGIDGTFEPLGWGLSNKGPFINLCSHEYWSGTVHIGNTQEQAWLFDFSSGDQDFYPSEDRSFYAMAVMDGDVAAVPIPSAIWLLGSGLIGLVGFRRMFRKEGK